MRNASVELLLDEDEVAKAAGEYRDVRRETRLNAMRRDRHLEMMRREGAEGLLAEIVESEGPRAALEWIAAAEADERKELRETLDRLLAGTGADREPFDHLEAERDLVNRITGRSSVPFGGTRSSRVQGLPAAEPPRPTPPDDDHPPPQYGYPAGPTQPPTGPPPDEPPGGPTGGTAPRHGPRAAHTYPAGIPASMDELFEQWGYASSRTALMENSAKRLVLFAPDTEPWSDLVEDWNQTLLFPSAAGEGLEEFEMDEIINTIVNSL
ncbi:hypothetical protein Acsp03_01120 [Actinomadura sp. NBRC 104412]|uniref:hypothetical protein n=1 Tax=Actinomadura sp. NBRC 104412 TaxID=3032203 RepID=UPI0024A0074F|nr:hypothetical protein [Actinomadura sp. NBRC 104412]GLZ02645.1 hypothetical protein Acsp03_01120 [Actinomadura sp. NBRC 104412]